MAIDLLSGLPGLRDFYPEDWQEVSYVLNKMREVSKSYGYLEYEGPSLELVELIEAKSGEGLIKEIFQLQDRNNRRLLLRPEQTPTLARMLAKEQQRYKRPLRWFSIPRLFRDETVQKGRVREFWQLNVDMLGENSLLADAETIAVAIDILRACGLEDKEFNVLVNHRNLLNSFITDNTEINPELLIPIIDKKVSLLQERMKEIIIEMGQSEVSADKISLLLRRIQNSQGDFRTKLMAELDESYLDLIENSDELLLEVMIEKFIEIGVSSEFSSVLASFVGIAGKFSEIQASLSKFELGERSRSAITELETLGTYLESFDVIDPVVFDLSMARGLDYYTGIVYEAFDATGEIVRAIFGGGRYADLVEAVGGTELSGVGFGMGETVLMELMKLRNTFPEQLVDGPDFYILSIGKDVKVQQQVIELSQRLKSHFSVVSNPFPWKKISRHFTLAEDIGTKVVIIIGKKDMENGVISLRTMQDSRQSVIPLDEEVESKLREMLNQL